MANFLDKIKVPTAINHNTPLDLSCDHVSTANFMQFNIAYSKEAVPGEHISIDMDTFTRMDPLVVPTFGRANIYNRCFFIPFRTIFRPWNNFITDTPYNDGTNLALVSTVHKFSNLALLSFLTSDDCAVKQSGLDIQDFQEGTESRHYDLYLQDFSATGATPRYNGYIFTEFGRQSYKILTQLGYTVNPDVTDLSYYSALPLLSCLKVYFDWYYPQAYANSNMSGILERYFSSNKALTLIDQDLGDIFGCLRKVCYDSDYFTAAFDNPFGPNNNMSSEVQIKDFNGPISYKIQSAGSNYTSYPYVGTDLISTANTGNGPFILSTATSAYTYNSPLVAVNQYQIDALKSLSDYLKRHQLVGGRALDRYMARFGIQLSSEKLNRSEYIGTDTVPIQIGDVMSNSDTSGASLGDYAGKGIGFGHQSFNYDADEYGMIIIVSTIIPKIGYYQGQNRNTMHLSKLDYYTPEFDNLSVQAISKRELFNPLYLAGRESGYTDADLNEGVFGYIPRYAEYKVGRDVVSGDYRLHSRNTGLNGWHMMREFTPSQYASASTITHNPSFIFGYDSSQYSRIFQNTNGSDDHFKMIYHFDVKSNAPMSSLFDNYHFETEGESKTVRENIGGVKMN